MYVYTFIICNCYERNNNYWYNIYVYTGRMCDPQKKRLTSYIPSRHEFHYLLLQIVSYTLEHFIQFGTLPIAVSKKFF